MCRIRLFLFNWFFIIGKILRKSSLTLRHMPNSNWPKCHHLWKPWSSASRARRKRTGEPGIPSNLGGNSLYPQKKNSLQLKKAFPGEFSPQKSRGHVRRKRNFPGEISLHLQWKWFPWVCGGESDSLQLLKLFKNTNINLKIIKIYLS